MTTTSSATSGSATITSLGVGSGLDAETIVSKLVALERQPINNLQTAADKIQTKISAFAKVQDAVSSFRDSARKLANPDIWGSTVATSADNSVVTFSTSSGATAGNYSMSVKSLASSQSVVMNTVQAASTSTLGSGSLSIEVGSWSGTAFTAKSGTTAKNVTIAATDTLEGIRDKINDAGAGVTASIIKDASGARIVLNSSSTGAANGFRIKATDNDGNSLDGSGISALAFDLDPLAPTTGSARTQTAADAQAKINGVSVTSTTNKFEDVLTGISFTVGKVTDFTETGGADTPVNVTIAQDNDTISKAINSFATSYSALVSLLREDTKYDADTKTAGVLQGDGTALSILNQFRSMVGGTGGNSTVFNTLSSIGVEVQSGGTLTVNSTKLNNSLGKLSEVKKLFAYANLSDSSQDGIATKLRTLGDNLLGFEGALTTRKDGLKKAVQLNQKRQDELDLRAALFEKRLRAQYTALDTQMGAISTQSNYVTQMITAWNKS
jgi:flagellar hook-associated protein 2